MDAKEIAEEIINQYDDNYQPGDRRLVPLAKAYLDLLEQNRWIPVGEQEPPIGVEFQGWLRTDNDDGGFWEPHCINDEDKGYGYYGRIDYDIDGWDFGLNHLTLTHWKHLPNVPEDV